MPARRVALALGVLLPPEAGKGDLTATLLELGGRGEGHVVEPQWPAILPGDPKGDAETALLHEQLGVSKDTLMTQLGFDPAAEAEKKQKEQKAEAAAAELMMTAFDRGQDGPPGRDDAEEERRGGRGR